jgi:hypothetical protein
VVVCGIILLISVFWPAKPKQGDAHGPQS